MNNNNNNTSSNNNNNNTILKKLVIMKNDIKIRRKVLFTKSRPHKVKRNVLPRKSKHKGIVNEYA